MGSIHLQRLFFLGTEIDGFLKAHERVLERAKRRGLRPRSAAWIIVNG